MKKTLFIIALLLAMNSFANDEHEEHKEGAHGDEHEEKMELPAGIVSFNDEAEEFVLKPNVITNFGIGYELANKTDQFIKVPNSAIVKSLNDTSVFVFNKNAFRHIKVSVVKSENNISFLKSTDAINGKLVVTKGTNFLKTILLSLEEGPSEGHGH